MHVWSYIQGRGAFLTFLTYQHASLAFQTVLVGTVVAVLIAVAVYRLPLFSALTLTTSRVALTIPSLALLALLLPLAACVTEPPPPPAAEAIQKRLVPTTRG